MDKEPRDPRKYCNNFTCTLDFAEAWNQHIDAIDHRKQVREKLDKLKIKIEEDKTNNGTSQKG